MKRNTGKWLERGLQDALELHCAGHHSACHRFADSRAARNIIPAQPGDFLWLIPSYAILIEAKSTEQAAPFKKLLTSAQTGRHRLWHRAGHPSVFVYGDTLKDVLQAWDGMDAIDLYLNKVRAEKWREPFFECDLDGYNELLEEIKTHVKTNY